MNDQAGLFGDDSAPEPVATTKPYVNVLVHFETPDNLREFEALMGQPQTIVSRKRAKPSEALLAPDQEFRREWQHWRGMPEYIQEDFQPYATALVAIESPARLVEFERLIEQKVPKWGKRDPSVRFPRAAKGTYMNKRYRSEMEAPQ